MRRSALLVLLALAACHGRSTADPGGVVTDDLLTVAEASGFTRTARHQEVVALMDALAAASPLARRLSLGTTAEGRDMPLLVLADPPVASAREARERVDQGAVLVFAFGNIHAGEVCAKEALLMVARDLVLAGPGSETAAVLERLVLVLAPIYNADGNERMGPDNRPGQVGPVGGMGERRNAEGLDLNRDYVKLESPEARAMVRFLTEWDPHLVFDGHTTNGSHHRYHLTYAPPLNPEGPPEPLAFVRDRMLPDVSAALRAGEGWRTFLYGNFDEDRTRWSTYSPHPRFGAQYHGLRGHLSILSEAYAYVGYEERVRVTRAFLWACLRYASAHADDLRGAFDAGRLTVLAQAREGAPLGVRHALEAAPATAVIEGWASHRGEDGSLVVSDEPANHEVIHEDHFVATRSVPRPLAYLVPPGGGDLVERLSAHGVRTRALAGGPREVEVQRWRLTSLERAEGAFEGHHLALAEVERHREDVAVGPGWVLVPVAQPLGTLAAYLLEPEAEDGLLAWGAFDGRLAVGQDVPLAAVVDPEVLAALEALAR